MIRKATFVAALASLSLLTAAPAFAHAQLVFSNPAVGATLTALPSKVLVTFDDNLIDLGPASNAISVTDPKGVRIEAGNSTLTNATLTVNLKPDALQGKYEVTYRVVSADGHPVSNSFPFYVIKKATPKAKPKATPKAPAKSSKKG